MPSCAVLSYIGQPEVDAWCCVLVTVRTLRRLQVDALVGMLVGALVTVLRVSVDWWPMHAAVEREFALCL